MFLRYICSDIHAHTNIHTHVHIHLLIYGYASTYIFTFTYVFQGGTDLTKVLKDAFVPTEKASTILIITDGKPDDINTTEKLIIETTKTLKHEEDLLVTIVQVGNDDKADEYLNELDNKLVPMGAKYDIVDIIPNAKLSTLDFAMVVDLAMKHHGN